MQTKFILSSWTFWFGVAQIAVGVFGALSKNLDQQAAYAMIVTGLGTIGFRFKTEGPVSLTPPSK